MIDMNIVLICKLNMHTYKFIYKASVIGIYIYVYIERDR